MAKTVKMKPDKFKELVAKQDQIQRPPTLGESTQVTNWLMHIAAGHKIKNYTRLKDDEKGNKKAYMTTPSVGMFFTAGKESFCGYYYVWIFCIQESTERIIYRLNSGDVDFVTWDIPEESKEVPAE